MGIKVKEVEIATEQVRIYPSDKEKLEVEIQSLRARDGVTKSAAQIIHEALEARGKVSQ